MAEQHPNQLTPNVNGTVRLTSPTPTGRYRAEVVKSVDHAREVGAKVIDRNSTILVQKVEIGEQGIIPGPLQESNLTGLSPVSNRVAPGDNFAARPQASDPLVAPRSTLIPDEPVQEPIKLGATIEGVVKKAAELAQGASVKTKKIKVQFAGKQFGKTTVFCQEAVVSDSLIVLAYNQNGDSAIVEPPIADIEAELMVRITRPDGVTDQYHVMSNEWSFEAMGLLWIVLIRIKAQD